MNFIIFLRLSNEILEIALKIVFQLKMIFNFLRIDRFKIIKINKTRSFFYRFQHFYSFIYLFISFQLTF